MIILTTMTVLFSNGIQADEITARNLLLSQGCKGCHFIDGTGGTLGPNLDQVGAKLKPAQLKEKLVSPKSTNPDSVMPSYSHLKEEELQALVDFLKTRNKRK